VARSFSATFVKPMDAPMIHVITAKNRANYATQMEEYFRLRYEVYVVERKWMQLDRADRREIDEFDNDDAIYLLLIEDDRVLGGTRFVPTTKPHLMSEKFPHLASVRGLQRRPDIVEWTRYFVIAERRGADRKEAHIVFAGMIEWCLDKGVSAIVVVMESWWLPHFAEYGWPWTPLGLPEDINGMNCVAVKIDVSKGLLTRAWANANVKSSVIVRTPAVERRELRPVSAIRA
jgi:acyl-homoserine lactone synthase